MSTIFLPNHTGVKGDANLIQKNEDKRYPYPFRVDNARTPDEDWDAECKRNHVKINLDESRGFSGHVEIDIDWHLTLNGYETAEGFVYLPERRK